MEILEKKMDENIPNNIQHDHIAASMPAEFNQDMRVLREYENRLGIGNKSSHYAN